MKVTNDSEKSNQPTAEGPMAAVQMKGTGMQPPPFQMKANPLAQSMPAQMKQGESEDAGDGSMQMMANPSPGYNEACGCAQCMAAPGQTAQLQKSGVIQRVGPSYLVGQAFLGHSPQVNPVLAARLVLVQAELQRQYDALPADNRPASLRAYSGLSSIRGWRSSTSKHGSGSAVDCNYDNQPYVPTRTTTTTGATTTTTYGGEEGGASPATRALRQPALEVMDRAVAFLRTDPSAATTADMSVRGTGETTSSVYRRFRANSNDLGMYMALVFNTNYNAVTRVPIDNVEAATEDQLLAAIPTTERRDVDTGVAEIQAIFDDPSWQACHPGYGLTAYQQYIRILRDYEIVRKPLQRGNPSTRPTNTRNPALGFLHMPEHFVVAMADIGNLRWGACDFGAGSSGDVHHFDLGNHGGYTPE